VVAVVGGERSTALPGVGPSGAGLSWSIGTGCVVRGGSRVTESVVCVFLSSRCCWLVTFMLALLSLSRSFLRRLSCRIWLGGLVCGNVGGGRVSWAGGGVSLSAGNCVVPHGLLTRAVPCFGHPYFAQFPVVVRVSVMVSVCASLVVVMDMHRHK